MALLKERYDRIVVDLAPIQAVSDALVVGKHANSAIYVIKADSTPLPVVQRGVERLREVGVKVAGGVISQVDIKKVSSYGGEYYYQGYYDYYGYGEGHSGKSKKSTGGNGNRRDADIERMDPRLYEQRVELHSEDRRRVT